MSPLAVYFQTNFGSSAADTANLLTVHAGGGVTVPCPSGEDCFSGPFIYYLVTYSDGDSEGEAVEVLGDSKWPSCMHVIIAGAGVIDTTELESLGFTAAQAQALESN